jgi:pyridoxine/pyridoxamine 5'-phosphate oxidase
MINIKKISNSEPFLYMRNMYEKALNNNQKNIEAILIASFDKNKDEVDARYVNLKSIVDEELFFFSNYKSPKSRQFDSHNQITAIFYWSSINVQIRMKAKIKKASKSLSDQHFKNRAKSKNALAISSNQSEKIDLYESVKNKYEKVLKENSLIQRPDYWGGFSFRPYYIEFWMGNENRLNKREVFEKTATTTKWIKYYLEP